MEMFQPLKWLGIQYGVVAIHVDTLIRTADMRTTSKHKSAFLPSYMCI
jgi:hypothetical protein